MLADEFSLPATVAGSFRSLVSLQITSAVLTVATHGLVAFQVSDFWFRLQLFRPGIASVSVAVVASTAAHLVPTAAAAFPSMYSALSSSAAAAGLSSGSPAAAAP